MNLLCIDGRMLGGGATGVGRYADMLLRASGAGLVLREADGPPPGRWARRLRAIRPGARRLRREADGLIAPPGLFTEAQAHFDLYGRSLALEVEGPAGIMHWTYPVPLHLKGWRNVYTVHDLIPLTRPDLTPISEARHRRLMRAILPHADYLLAVSEAERATIARLLGFPAERIGNAGQGVDPRPGPSRMFRPDAFYLFCGTIEPRKNLARLAEAHARSGSTRPLVIAGPVGNVALAGELDARPGVILLPYQADSVLHAWMRDARALLFPSLAEGFGLPVAEAMTLGTAVLTSGEGALAETAGGAALTVDPLDVDGLTEAIGRLDGDDALVADLAARGRNRAQAFAIPAYSARLSTFYRSIA